MMKRAMVDCRVERSWWLAGWLAGSGWLDCLSFSLSLYLLRGMCTTLMVVVVARGGKKKKREKKRRLEEARAEVKEEARGRDCTKKS